MICNSDYSLNRNLSFVHKFYNTMRYQPLKYNTFTYPSDADNVQVPSVDEKDISHFVRLSIKTMPPIGEYVSLTPRIIN